jgi:hypothetical protein
VKKSSRVIVVPPLRAAVRRQKQADELRLHADLGKITRFWANLHEHLAFVLAKTIECADPIAFSMWHSLKSDLSQRELLAAAIKAKIALLEKDAEKATAVGKHDVADQNLKQAELFAEYLWAVGEITKYSGKRNDLVHSPIHFFHGGPGATVATEYEAIVSDHHGNPKAVRLKGRELFQLCGWMIAFISEIFRFVAMLGHSRSETDPLPPRPKWLPDSAFPARKQSPKAKRKVGKKQIRSA